MRRKMTNEGLELLDAAKSSPDGERAILVVNDRESVWDTTAYGGYTWRDYCEAFGVTHWCYLDEVLRRREPREEAHEERLYTPRRRRPSAPGEVMNMMRHAPREGKKA